MELYGFRVGRVINDKEIEECGFTNADGYTEAMANILYAYNHGMVYIYKIDINKVNDESTVIFVDKEDYKKIEDDNIY